MSRVAGFIQKQNANFQDISDQMLDGITSSSIWQQAKIKINHFGFFVWAGWRLPEIVKLGHITIAIDGIFYNREEIDLITGNKNKCNDVMRMHQLYKKFGFEDSLNKINGDFSISLFDENTNELYLGRDRFGVKPMYYADFNTHFAFASRPRALFAVPNITRDINKRFAALFGGSHYRYIDNVSEESPYQDIKQLPAAHILKLSKNKICIKQYWHLIDQPNFDAKNKDKLGLEYRDLLLDAVQKRLQASGGNSAFTLSGGLDSSSVLACAVESEGKKQEAFSSVYSDKTYDESDDIRSMLSLKVEKWNPVEIDVTDVFELVDKMTLDHDEPVATATWLSHYLLCDRVSSSGFTSLFGGLGGDELNAGEYEHFFFHFADLKFEKKESVLLDEVLKWAQYHDHPIYKKNISVVNNSFEKIVDLTKSGICKPHVYSNSKYQNAINVEYFDMSSFRPFMDHPFKSYLKNRTYQDIFRETAPCCLRAEDRQSTRFNLDHIDPFFDYKLVEFMYRIPGELKIKDGVTKILLREAMKGILPEETRVRIKKTGWNAPAHLWFSTNEFSEQLGDLIDSRFFKNLDIYNIQVVKKLFESHKEIVRSNQTAENHMMFFWQLINLCCWLKNIKE